MSHPPIPTAPIAPTPNAPTRPTRRWPHLLLGVAALVVAALALLSALDQATLTYTLPPQPDSTSPNRHTVAWPPGVIASVIAGLAVVVGLGWTVWSAVRRPPRRLWLLPAGLSALAVLVVAAVGGMPMPAF